MRTKLLCGVLLAATAVFGQVVRERFQIRVPGPPPGMEGPGGFGMAVGGPGEGTFEFVSGEMSFEGRTVKGAPYSGEATTETEQVLADGNRIRRRNASTVYRDTDGRTRREMTVGAIGPLAAQGGARQTVFINDPVAGVNYVLDPAERTARKMTRRERPMRDGETAPARAGGPGRDVLIQRAKIAAAADRPQPRTESLGKRMIEGVEAEGTRITLTLPAGEIGNERPIEIVTERWYSPDLKTIVLSRRSDPRMGETTYKLTNIRRTEPLRSLFEAPPDYTLKEGPAFEPAFDRRRPGPPPR